MSDLISRQAVLDELEKWDWQDLYLPIHFKQILDDVPSVENKGEWIPVSERLPENSDYVLVTDGLDMFVAWHNPEKERFKGWHSFDELFDLQTPIVAWQPLPEPYKSEKPETCKGCLEPCIMYEPDMRACKKKVTERGE